MRRLDWIKIGIAVAIALGCIGIPQSLAQNPVAPAVAPATDSPRSPASSSAGASLMETGILPNAMQLYRQSVRELHQGHAVPAENDALRALHIDSKFADAAALAATAALKQQQFKRAGQEAAQALAINSADEKAWVILATADNYLGQYSDAVDALSHVTPLDQETWQVSYQWARAEAGLQNLQQCLQWSNRAPLSAPLNFAPLHLLRASVFLAAGETALAADQLKIYLQLPDVSSSQRGPLTQELHRLHKLSQQQAATSPIPGDREQTTSAAN